MKIIFATLEILVALSLMACPVKNDNNPSGKRDRPIVGAIRWDAWIGDIGNDLGDVSKVGLQVERSLNPNKYHYRAPFFSKEISRDSILCRGTTQEIMDQEIAYAKYAGLDYWAFCWYPPHSGLDTARILYLASSHKSDINWCVILGTNPFDYNSDARWLVQRFKEDNYQKVLNGRPLVYIFPDRETTPDQINLLRKLCRSESVPEPYITIMESSAKNAAAKADSFHADAVSSYNSWTGKNGEPYSPVIPRADSAGWENHKATGRKVIPWITLGHNTKPRIDHPVSWMKIATDEWVSDGSPREIAENLCNALQWVNNNKSVAEPNTILMYAWNEFDEGGWLCPTLGNNTERLDAIEKVLRKPHPFIREIKTGYLLNCNFNALEPYSWKGEIPLSGWETDKSGGTWDYSRKKEFDLEWFRLIDTSDKAAVRIKHQIARQTEGKLTLEFRFMLPNRMDGACWQLSDLSQAGVCLITKGENLCWMSHGDKLKELMNYKPGQEYGVKIVADLTDKTAAVYIDGQLRIKAASFRIPVKSIDYVSIKTGDASTGDLYLSPVNLYKGYLINETFVTCGEGRELTDWNCTDGNVKVKKFLCAPKPDIFSLRLDGSSGKQASAKIFFPAVKKCTVFEYRFLLPQTSAGFEAQFGGIRLVTTGADLCYLDNDSKPVTLWKDYRANLWYMVKVVIDPGIGMAEIFLNGKAVADKVPVNIDEKWGSVMFETHVPVWVDDVKVYAWQDYATDYVPEPKPCTPTNSRYIVGLQSCDLWREGTAYAGWEYIYPFRNLRKPYLGWYDEGNPEVNDWEVKWQVEHGISYVMHCWYRPSLSAVGNPIKDGDMDQSLLKGLFNARYSNFMKFAIMYTNDNGGFTTPDDFRKNIVPYWIDYFFKDPRYFKIDGKPVVSLYNYDKLVKDMGSAEEVRKAVQYLRDEAVKAGLPGLIVLTVQFGTAPTIEMMKLRKAAGFDGVYAYCAFTKDVAQQKQKNFAQRDAATKVGLDMIPSFGMGWEASPWNGKQVTRKEQCWDSKEEYKSLALWMRDEFLPSQPINSLGRNMMLLDSWNEFGEGHFIMPSEVAGFDYLDALREVFTNGGQHKDLNPTDEQKQRLNLLYPRN